jgi:NAD(P)-dependent dehydrogenase (short-subunit alcohol dehydrogenase family)
MRTPLSEKIPQEKLDKVLSIVPMGRFAEVEEVVGVIRFLASDEASYVTGATFVVDGGYTAV